MEKPDFEIEQFWLGLKNSMINFYINKIIKRPIKDWSNRLNLLQKQEKYNEIEMNIRNYISLYGIDLIRIDDCYHFGILKTNIKRWNKISKQYGFNIKENKMYYNLIFLLIDIYDTLKKKLNKDEFYIFFSQIELLIMYEDFNYLIEICIKYKISSVLDKLNDYINIYNFISKKYNITFDNNYTGRKLMNYITSQLS